MQLPFKNSVFFYLIYTTLFGTYLSQTKLGYIQFGTTGNDTGLDVTLDPNSNVYIVGNTDGSFEGFTNKGSLDAFIVKYNTTGALEWVRQSGTDQSDSFSKVKTDSNGNIYAFGATDGSYPTFTNSGQRDLLLVKYSPTGSVIWVKQFGTSGFDRARSMAIDSTGNLYLTGDTTGEFTNNTSKGGIDSFVIKCDSSGNILKTLQFGTILEDSGKAIDLDSVGNVIITGNTKGAFDTFTNLGENDIFTIKLDSDLQILWTKQIGTPADDVPSAVCIDPSNAVIVVGTSMGNLGTTNKGLKDLVLIRYDAQGVQQYVRQHGTTSSEETSSCAIYPTNLIYVLKTTSGTYLGNINYGMSDIVLSSYAVSNGNLIISPTPIQMGTTESDWGLSLALDKSNNYYITGKTNGVLPQNTSKGQADALLITRCFKDCETCRFSGGSSNHNCLTCKTNYFPLSDKLAQCFTSTIDNYYLDVAAGQYKPCYSSCLRCSATGDASNHNCISCKSGHKKTSDKLSNCFISPPDGYYLDATSQQFMPCFSSCLSCEKLGDSTNHSCSSCKSGFYPKSDNLTNCFNSPPSGFYLDTSTRQFKNCYLSCSKCEAAGDEKNHNCTECKLGFFPLSDKLSNCFSPPPSGTPSGYYFSDVNKKYFPCHISCRTCNSAPSSDKMNCLSCKEEFYFKSDEITNCYKNVTSDYYFNSNLKIFKPCHRTCKSCDNDPNELNMNCIDCKEPFSYAPDFRSCFNSTTAPENYYLNLNDKKYFKCYKSCSKCSSAGTENTHNCETCAKGYNTNFITIGNCDNCGSVGLNSTDQGFMYKNLCISKCPNTTISETTLEGLKRCTDCMLETPYVLNNKCLSKCPENHGIIGDNNICVNCSDLKLINFNNKCIDKCPDSLEYDKDSNSCSLKMKTVIDVLNSQVNCTTNPCLFGGECIIKLMQIECICQKGYFGKLCELSLQDTNKIQNEITNLVSNVSSFNLSDTRQIQKLENFNTIINQNSSMVTQELSNQIQSLTSKYKLIYLIF